MSWYATYVLNYRSLYWTILLLCFSCFIFQHRVLTRNAGKNIKSRREERCRSSCEDVISSPFGKVLASVDDYSHSSELATSAIGALFHLHDAKDEQLQSVDPMVQSPQKRREQERSILSAVRTDTLPPRRLPSLIEELVGAVDSIDSLDDNARNSLIREERHRSGAKPEPEISRLVGKAGDNSTVAVEATAAAVAFWSKRKTALSGHRMQVLNGEWNDSLRWISGWGADQLHRTHLLHRASENAISNNRVRAFSTNKDEKNMLLVEMCVDECVGITGVTKRKDWRGGNGTTSMAAAENEGERSMLSALTGKLGIARLALSSIAVLALWSVIQWFSSSSILPIALPASFQYDNRTESWRRTETPHGKNATADKGRGKTKTASKKRGRKKKSKAGAGGRHRVLRQRPPQKDDSVGVADYGEEFAVAGHDDASLKSSISNSNLTDDEDDPIVASASAAAMARSISQTSLLSSSHPRQKALTQGKPLEVEVHRMPPKDRNISFAGQPAPADESQPSPTRRREQRRKRDYHRKVYPDKALVPTQAQRAFATQKLRQFQQAQVEKLRKRKKTAEAIELSKVRAWESGAVVSYSAVASGSGSSNPAPTSEVDTQLSNANDMVISTTTRGIDNVEGGPVLSDINGEGENNMTAFLEVDLGFETLENYPATKDPWGDAGSIGVAIEPRGRARALSGVSGEEVMEGKIW